ncbi:MAG: diguanylate cyclase [Oscillatoriales cyanobacterium SM2_2_1]|nr:diguanylate cyclase [Oscillatoriales cyanobacterium SM2_2_1]
MLPEALRESRLLLVDDDEMNRDILSRHLRKQGYQHIRMAVNGSHALELIHQSLFDLVLLDISMPEMNGMQVLDVLKESDTLDHIPVLMVSALQEKDMIARCIEKGAEDYLTKPYDQIILRARVSACLEKKHLRDQERHTRQQLEQAYKELEDAYRRLEVMSQLDGLTGVANRSCFEQVLTREWQISLRCAESFAIVLFDIDYFKQFNDSYGHLCGDECLKQVAKAAECSIFRPRDLVARYGGEEFILILPDTDRAGALTLGERLRSQVEALGIAHQSSAVSAYVTVSVGVAQAIAQPNILPKELIQQADAALYESKREGRNRVKVWASSPCVA